MFSSAWKLLKETVMAFIDDEALSRGAAIAFYTVTSIAPILLIVIAIAGLVFGQDAAQNAITTQLSGLMGQQTAELLQTAVAAPAASRPALGDDHRHRHADRDGFGCFRRDAVGAERIWKAKPKGTTVSRLIRARAASLGLVAALGFLLMVSLVVSAGLSAFGDYLNAVLPFGKVILNGSIYRFLGADLRAVRRDLQGAAGHAARVARCDRRRGRDGGSVHVGKSLIGWYIGSSAVASSLRRRRRADRAAALGLLLGADLPARRRVHKALCQPPRQQAGRSAGISRPRSEPRVDPGGGVVEQVLRRVRILPGRLLARLAGREAVLRALDHDEVLVLAAGDIEIALAVADVIVPAHRHEQLRAPRSTVARRPSSCCSSTSRCRPWSCVARIACALRNERNVKIFVPVLKRAIVARGLGSARSTLWTTCVATVPSLRRSFCGRAVLLKYGVSGCVTKSADSEPPAPEPGLPLAGDHHDVVVGIGVVVALDARELVLRHVDQPVHAVGLRLEIARLEFRRIVRRPVRIEPILRIEHVEFGDRRRIGRVVLVGGGRDRSAAAC